MLTNLVKSLNILDIQVQKNHPGGGANTLIVPLKTTTGTDTCSIHVFPRVFQKQWVRTFSGGGDDIGDVRATPAAPGATVTVVAAAATGAGAVTDSRAGTDAAKPSARQVEERVVVRVRGVNGTVTGVRVVRVVFVHAAVLVVVRCRQGRGRRPRRRRRRGRRGRRRRAAVVVRRAVGSVPRGRRGRR